MKFFFITTSIFLLTISSCAGEKLALTLEQCLEMGEKNNRVLHSALMNLNYAEARHREVSAARLPSLKFNAAYARLSEVSPFSLVLPGLAPIEVTLFPLIPNNYNFRLTLQQPIFTGFNLYNVEKSAFFNLQSTNWDYRKIKVELSYNIENNYWQLSKALELQKVAQENVARMEAHLKDIENFFAQGLATKDEVLQVQVRVSNSHLFLLETKKAVQMARLALNSILSLPLDAEIQIASFPDSSSNAYPDLNPLILSALEKQPELKVLEYSLKAAQSNVNAAKSVYFPQVYLQSHYYYDRPNQRIFPAEDKFNDTWDLGITLSFDLWNWGKNSSQVEQARAKFLQVQDALAQLKDNITLEVTQNFLSLQEAQEAVSIARVARQQSEESHRIIREKFHLGLVKNSDLLDAEVELLKAQTNYQNAVIDFQLALANMRRSIGE
jgi:outer membrane protein TolC